MSLRVVGYASDGRRILVDEGPASASAPLRGHPIGGSIVSAASRYERARRLDREQTVLRARRETAPCPSCSTEIYRDERGSAREVGNSRLHACRCGVLMPIAGMLCARTQRHGGRHRSAAQLAKAAARIRRP